MGWKEKLTGEDFSNESGKEENLPLNKIKEGAYNITGIIGFAIVFVLFILFISWILGGSQNTKKATQSCHPNYSGCLRADASDYDCIGGGGNGPYYTGKVRVIGSDVFGLDRDGDGWGCE
ncbi:MAG: hypothetical protein PHO28_02015 [Candidatus Pacebacteria bacterium]|nr:hypothetical protein [Candidatus Paceibacterota bacterium]